MVNPAWSIIQALISQNDSWALINHHSCTQINLQISWRCPLTACRNHLQFDSNCWLWQSEAYLSRQTSLDAKLIWLAGKCIMFTWLVVITRHIPQKKLDRESSSGTNNNQPVGDEHHGDIPSLVMILQRAAIGSASLWKRLGCLQFVILNPCKWTYCKTNHM